MKRLPRQLRYAIPLALLAFWTWSYVHALTIRLDWPGGCLYTESREGNLTFDWHFGQAHEDWLRISTRPARSAWIGSRTTHQWLQHHITGFAFRPMPHIRCASGMRMPGRWYPPPRPPQVAVMHYQAAFPWWFVLLSCAVPTSVRFVRAALRRPRTRPECCSTCGYDLRATPHRCPECGRQPPTNAHA